MLVDMSFPVVCTTCIMYQTYQSLRSLLNTSLNPNLTTESSDEPVSLVSQSADVKTDRKSEE